jgi:hypothetical protein
LIDRLSGALMLSRRELLGLVLVFAVSLPAVTPRLYSSDEVQYFSYLRSLWFDRDVSFENEYQYFYDRQVAQTPDFHETFLERQTPAGRRINFGTIGSALLWAPFYGVADLSTRIARAAGSSTPADGFSKPYVAAVAYASAFYAFAAVLLGIRAARVIVGSGGLPGGCAVWLGTPLFFYMYIAPPFSHACSAFAVALFITVWLHVRRAWSMRGAVALGLSGALVAMVREQDIFFLLGPAVDFALSAYTAVRSGRTTRDVVLSALAGCAAFFFGMLPQLVAYQALNGHPSPSTYVIRKMYWHSPHAVRVLFDPEHGFLFWTPLAALSIAGLIALAAGSAYRPGDATQDTSERAEAAPGGGGTTDRARVAWCLILMMALQVYVSGAVDSWTVAGAFGQRRFVAVSAILTIGLAALWNRTSPHAYGRIALGLAVCICVYWNLALVALFGTRMMDRQRIELRRNAYDAFITLPRIAPGLVWRYFNERESFYNAGSPAESP